MEKFITRAGFVGFGEVNTPREFIDDRCHQAAESLRAYGIEVFETAPVSDDPAGSQADRAAAELAKNDFDVLVLCVAGWIPSWAVVRTIEKFKHLPILLWGQSGWVNGDHFVTTADQAGTTALRGPLTEMGFKVRYLVNFKGSAPRTQEAAEFIFAAGALKRLHSCKIGMGGYRDMTLYGTLYDGTALKGTLGVEIEHFDLMEIADLMNQVTAEDVAKYSDKIRSEWDFIRPPKSQETLAISVKLALAFLAKIKDRKYDAFSFNDVDGVKKLFKFAPAGAITLLHELVDLPTTPENDSYGTVTELLMTQLTGKLAYYLEFYEFTENSALMGVPDYVPGAVVQGKITVMPNAFGSFGEGLLNVSKLKTGEVTIARLYRKGGKFVIHAALGNAVTPPKWEEAGWAPPAPQLPSLEVKFASGKSEDFLQNVAGQHYVVSYGNQLNLLKEYCNLAGIELIIS